MAESLSTARRFRRKDGQISREYTLKIRVTEDERALLKRAAGQAGWSVRVWAETNLVTLAEVETSGS